MELKSQNEKHPKTPKASRTIMGWKPLSDFQLAWYNAANTHFSFMSEMPINLACPV